MKGCQVELYDKYTGRRLYSLALVVADEKVNIHENNTNRESFEFLSYTEYRYAEYIMDIPFF